MVELRVRAIFEAAHNLPSMPEKHKCHGTHGHRYEVEIAVSGEPNSKTGILIDYHDIRVALWAELGKLDHSNLNSIRSIGEPTTENLCKYLWKRLHRNQGLNMLSEIRIQESPDFCCVFRGPV